MRAVIGDNPVDEGDPKEEACEETPVGELLSEEERDLLVKRLAGSGLPTREIVWITVASGRTIARSMQRFGIRRKKPERNTPPKKRHDQRLIEILTQYYSFNEVTLDSLDQLARENGLSFGKLINLIQEHVSPSRWAMRNCLACSQPALTSSPADRYCAACKKKVKKRRKGVDELSFG